MPCSVARYKMKNTVYELQSLLNWLYSISICVSKNLLDSESFGFRGNERYNIGYKRQNSSRKAMVSFKIGISCKTFDRLRRKCCLPTSLSPVKHPRQCLGRYALRMKKDQWKNKQQPRGSSDWGSLKELVRPWAWKEGNFNDLQTT